MSRDIRNAAQKVVDAWLGDCTGGSDNAELDTAISLLRVRLQERRPMTDEEISALWHQAGGQPFKFARMIEGRP